MASGKSLFLLGLLGEADLAEGGTILFPRSHAAPPTSSIAGENWLIDSVAFVPQVRHTPLDRSSAAHDASCQTPWLQNASIKAQILLGLPLDRQRYAQVLDACSLRSDLSRLPDGDETEVGERGLTLSGGQKARVSLARAVYSRARTLVLDDILSAVDGRLPSVLSMFTISQD